MKYKIAAGSARREDTLFAISRIYGSSFYARPFVVPGGKSEFEQLADALGIEVNSEVVAKLYKEFRATVKQELAGNRVTGPASYKFKTDRPSGKRIFKPNGLPTNYIKSGDRITYKPGSYLNRIFYRMQSENEFTIFIGAGSQDISSLMEGENLKGGRTQRFVTYSAFLDVNLPNRQAFSFNKDTKIFMPYDSAHGGPRWVTIKAGRKINPPSNRPVDTTRIWNNVIDRYKDEIVKVTK